MSNVTHDFPDETEAEKNEHKRELNQVITAVLRRHPMLHYFQGYHDIVQVLLLVLGANECIPSVERLSLLRIRDFMLPTMSGTEHHLRLLPSILYAADPEVCQHLSKTQPFFALAATLTLYAHDIEEYGDISRLFDFLLASEAVVSLYLFAVVRFLCAVRRVIKADMKLSDCDIAEERIAANRTRRTGNAACNPL